MPTAKLYNGTSVRLGRIKPKSRPQALRLANYVDLSAVTLPASVDYSAKAQASISRMFRNDTWGCCVVASAAHSLGVWTGNDSPFQVANVTDQEIQSTYFFFSPRDQGVVISQFLDYWKANGLTLGGKLRKIDGYVAVNWTSKDLVKAAILIFGGIKLGISLPNAWATSAPTVPWDVTRSRIVGGHDVLAVGYNEVGVIVSTWGSLRTITWQAFLSNTYLDEAYVMLAPEWYGDDKLSGSGVDVDKLRSDLQLIGGGQIPPIVPDPLTPPTPDPVPVPPIPTPKPTSLTQEQVIQAIKDGIAKGSYGWMNVNVAKVQAAAIEGVQDAWPRANRSPLPSEVAEEILAGRK